MDKSESQSKQEQSRNATGNPSKWFKFCQRIKYKAITKRNERQSNNKETNWPSWIQAISTVLIVLITGFYTYYASNQAKEMKRSVDAFIIQADAWEKSERAWMSFNRIISNNFFNASEENTGKNFGDGTMFSIEWKNAGHTPAIKVDLCSMGKTIPKQGTIPFFSPPADIAQHKATLVPDVSVQSPPCHFRKADIEALRDGKLRIFIYARATYETVFSMGTFKYTEVCIEVRYAGVNSKTNEIMFSYIPIGVQNSTI